jgi:hypothetical protein
MSSFTLRNSKRRLKCLVHHIPLGGIVVKLGDLHLQCIFKELAAAHANEMNVKIPTGEPDLGGASTSMAVWDRGIY